MKTLTTASTAMAFGLLLGAAASAWSGEEAAAPVKEACSCAKGADHHLDLARSYVPVLRSHRTAPFSKVATIATPRQTFDPDEQMAFCEACPSLRVGYW